VYGRVPYVVADINSSSMIALNTETGTRISGNGVLIEFSKKMTIWEWRMFGSTAAFGLSATTSLMLLRPSQNPL